MPPPLAVKVVLVPVQKVLLPLMLGLGLALTVMSVLAVLVQPLPAVTVTLYVLVLGVKPLITCGFAAAVVTPLPDQL